MGIWQLSANHNNTIINIIWHCKEIPIVRQHVNGIIFMFKIKAILEYILSIL